MGSLREPCDYTGRREVIRAAFASAILAGAVMTATPAKAQTAGDIDALNLVLNMEYLLAQFESAAVAAAVPADRLTGNGIAGVAVRGGAAVSFSDTVLRSMVQEMANDNRNHLLPIRNVIGALSVRQPLIDISVSSTAPFSVLMQQAGVVGAGATFNPYASEENFLYAMFFLKNVSVATYRGLASTISNRVVVQNFTGLLGAEAIHLATIRSYLYARGATNQRLRDNADKIAAYQNSLNGGGVFQGVSPRTRTTAVSASPITVANIAPAQSDGAVSGRSAGQMLNQFYLSSAATASGGFFPEGVNGTIRTSASA